MRAYEGGTFTGTQKQLWPAALPAANSDSYGYQSARGTQVRWVQSVALASEPWLLLNEVTLNTYCNVG